MQNCCFSYYPVFCDKPPLQARIFQNPQEVESQKTKLQAEILQNPQEVEFINQNYKKIYCKIIKRLYYIKTITGRYIAKFSKGETFRQTLQEEIL